MEGEKQVDGKDEDTTALTLASAEDMIKATVRSLKQKRLLRGYASYLCEQPRLRSWEILAKEDAVVWPWFESFFCVTMKQESARQFDHACRLIMRHLFLFAESALDNRKRNAED